MFKNKLLVLIIISLIIITSFVFILLDIIKNNNDGMKPYYEIAQKKALELQFNVKKSLILFDRDNVEWNEILKDLKEDNPEYAKRFDILVGRSYKTIKIYPKNKYAIGGVLLVFIDENTKEVITVYEGI